MISPASAGAGSGVWQRDMLTLIDSWSQNSIGSTGPRFNRAWRQSHPGFRLDPGFYLFLLFVVNKNNIVLFFKID
jgi:hypothetical protein